MKELPLFPWWLTVVLAVWAALGPLVGIFVGHYLTTSWERKRWIADNRLQEWRELIVAMMSSFTTIAKLAVRSLDMSILDAIEQEGVRSIEIINNRIFIHEDITRIKLLERWHEATDDFMKKDHDRQKFCDRFETIIESIRLAAKKDLENFKSR